MSRRESRNNLFEKNIRNTAARVSAWVAGIEWTALGGSEIESAFYAFR